MMADKTKKGVFILLVMSIVGIFVVFEDDATAKEMWDSVQHSLRFGPPCSCYKCVTEEDDVWFMERFNESVHPFLTPENILTEPNFYWWKTLMYDYFSLTDYRIAEKKVFALFPYNENFMDSQPDRCRTCAVVGNSINLLGSRYGPLIDYNDVVIRFNQAPIKGYEKDVGNKTTIHIMYPESATDLDNNTNLVFFPFKSKDLQWLISAFTEGSITFTYKTVKAKIKANKNLVKIINPYFMKYVHESWLKRRGRVPSTGFMGLILALHICDEVNVFGFGVDENGNWRIYWEELKNKLFGTGFHSGSLEYKLIRQLSERQKINFFKGW